MLIYEAQRRNFAHLGIWGKLNLLLWIIMWALITKKSSIKHGRASYRWNQDVRTRWTTTDTVLTVPSLLQLCRRSRLNTVYMLIRTKMFVVSGAGPASLGTRKHRIWFKVCRAALQLAPGWDGILVSCAFILCLKDSLFHISHIITI